MNVQTDFLERNLASLPEGDQRLLAAMSDASPVGLDAETGQLVLTTPDGRRIRLHSARNPEREADAVIDQALGGGALADVAIIIGAGSGHVVDRLEARGPATTVVVLEPFVAAARALLSRRDLSARLASGGLRVLIGPDYAASPATVRCLAGAVQPLILPHPVLLRERPEDLRHARQALDRLRFESGANAEAERQFAWPYLANTLTNLQTIVASRDVASLFERFPGVPAIVIAAGPSLDENVNWLRQVRDRAIFIAVDTALRPLVVHGLEPDVVVAVDPSETNARHFAHVGPLSRAWLVAEGSIDPSCFAPFADRVRTFRVGDNHPWPFLRAHGVDRGTLTVWGSVVTAACDLAIKMGCGPIVFAGADLGFSGGQPYCRGTAYEADWTRGRLRGRTLDQMWSWHVTPAAIDVEDVRGGFTKTTPVLKAFRDWIVDTSRQTPGVSFINATGAGILTGGAIRQVNGDEVEGLLPSRASTPALDIPATPPAGESSRLIDALREVRRLIASDGGGESPSTPIAEAADRGSVRDTANEWRALPTRSPLPAALHTIVGSALQQLSAQPVRLAMPPVWSDDTTPVGGVPVLRRALEHERLVAAPIAEASRLVLDALPPWRLLEWTAQARADVASLERWMRAAWLALPDPSPVPELGPPVRAIPQTPPIPEDVSSEPGVSKGRDARLQDVARLSLCREWILLARAESPRPERSAARAGWRLLADAVDREIHALLDVDTDGDRSGGVRFVHVDLGQASAPIGPFAGPLAELSRSLAGLIRRAEDSAFERTPAERFFTAPVHVHAPVSLLTAGAPPAVIGSSSGSSEAIFAVFESPDAIVVGEDGGWRLMQPWPRPIRGLCVVDAQGTTVAWHPEGRYVMSRIHEAGDVMVQDVEFQPTSCYVDDSGELWWTGKTGGLWRGRPGLVTGPVAETPPLLSVQRADARLSLEPITRDANGGPIRRRLKQGYDYRVRITGLEPRALPPYGQRGFVSAGGEWTASPYPYADIVRLTAPGREALDLLCYYPMTAAWAGRSLVVATGAAEMLFFENLADTLSALVPARGPAS